MALPERDLSRVKGLLVEYVGRITEPSKGTSGSALSAIAERARRGQAHSRSRLAARSGSALPAGRAGTCWTSSARRRGWTPSTSRSRRRRSCSAQVVHADALGEEADRGYAGRHDAGVHFRGKRLQCSVLIAGDEAEMLQTSATGQPKFRSVKYLTVASRWACRVREQVSFPKRALA